MKIANRILKVLIGFACAASSTAAFGQAVTHIWSGAGDGTNLDLAANWDGVLPSTANNDEGQFNGVTTSNLVLNYSIGNFQSGPGQAGINFHLTSNQTNSVQFTTSFSDSHTSGGAGSLLLAITHITNDPGSGPFILGPTDPTKLLAIIGRPNGATHIYENDSTNTSTINPRILWKAGGGAAWTFDFKGTGNWQVNNNLMNDNGPGISIIVDGPGTMFWNPAVGYQNANALSSPVTINAGKMVLQSPHPKWGNQAITLAGTLEYDAPGLSQTFSGNISDLPATPGSGVLQVNNGTLTLSGNGTYTGKFLLSGGELFVNRAENVGFSGPLGFGGTISFTGGTLGYSVNNQYDYSPRFDTSPGQQYRIDTAGQNVAFTNLAGLNSVGGTLTKLGPGTLTLAGANAYGDTFISAGKLLFQGTKSGTGNITVSNSTILSVTENGSQITPATLTVGTTGGATLEFNNVASTTTAPLAAGTISAGGTITVNVASGSFAVGQSYPLFTWTSGNPPSVALGTLVGAVGNLSTNTGTKTIQLNVTGLAYIWSGLTDGNWDTTTANNWKVNGASTVWSDGNAALFDDNSSGVTNINLNSPVAPASTTINSSSNVYTITSAGANNIGGSGGLTKNGNSVLTLSGGANTYTGPTTLSLGTINAASLANGGVASDIGAANNSAASLVFNGGTLFYSGPGASIDRLFSVTTAGGAIDNEGGTLTLNNTGAIGLIGTGARTLTLTGSAGVSAGDTLAAVIADNGGPTAVTKNGVGLWILTANNTYSGLTTIANGELQIGTGGANGSIGTGNVVNNGRLDFNFTGTQTIPGVISGSGSLTNEGGGTLILTGNNTYSGNTTVGAGSTLQVGTGGANGTLNGNTAINVNGTFILNSTTPLVLANFGNNITGTGNVIVRPGAFLNSQVQNSYTGWTQIDPGGTFQPTYGNSGSLASSVITNNGTLLFLRQDAFPTDTGSFAYSNNIVGAGRLVKENNNFNVGVIGLLGTNTYTGGTFIGGGGIILGDNLTPGAGSIVGDVVFTNTTSGNFLNRSLVFNRPDDFTFAGNIISVVTDSSRANSGAVTQQGFGTTTLTGNNSYPGTTTITLGTLQIGNGGATGSIGSGPINNNATLVFNLSSTQVVPGVISGIGTLVKEGTGTVAIPATNTYTGGTTVSNGTLRISTAHIGNGDFTVNDGATLAVTNTGSGATALINNLNLGNGGASTMEFINVSDPLTRMVQVGSLNLNGTPTIKITGSSGLVAGNTYPLIGYVGFGTGTFNLSLPAGVTATVTNDVSNAWIALNVTAVTAQATPSTIKGITQSGTNVIISATNNGGGSTWTLVGTNNLTAPLSTWPVISTGSFNNGSISITNPIGTGNQFFILRTP